MSLGVSEVSDDPLNGGTPKRIPGELDNWKNPAPKPAQWWRAKELELQPHQILDSLVHKVENDQQGRYEAYREWERLFGATVYSHGDDAYRATVTNTLSQNELQSTIETLWAQIFKNKVVPAISVSEADWEEWDRARAYSRWLEGAFDDTKVYEEVFPKAGVCFLVHGTGLIRVGWKEDASDDERDPEETDGSDDSYDESDTGEPPPSSRKTYRKCAKVYSWSVNPKYFLVDRYEAKHGKPRNFYFKDHVDRYQLFETYKDECEGFYGTPEDRCTGIWKCTGNDDLDLPTQNVGNSDMLTVREAFHLPSAPRAKDGRHVIWVKGCTLVDEPYTWDRPPFVSMVFGCPLEGFYGESCVKRLAPTQRNLDKLCAKIDEGQDVMGVPRILLGRQGNAIKLEHVDDIPGGILKCDDINQVRDWNAQCSSPEMYQDRDSAPRKMRSLLGISDFESTQQIPQGMRDVSGAMLERWVDQGVNKNAMAHAQYENAVVGLAELYMLQAKACQDMGYDVVCCAPADGDKSTIEMLKFSDVYIDRKRLKLKVQSMSNLPQTFAGKVESLEKLKNAGYPLNPKTAMRMIEIPDIEGATDILDSSEEIIFKNLCHMTKTGQYLGPMPFDDLDLIIRMTTDYINWYRRREKVDYDVVSMLAQYIDEAVVMKNGGPGSADKNAPPPPMSTMGALGLANTGMAPGMPGQGGAPVTPGMVPPGPMGPPGIPPAPVPPPMGPPPEPPMMGPMGPPSM